MRTPIALAIYVCVVICVVTGIFATSCFAEDPAAVPVAVTPGSPNQTLQEWTTAYEAGLSARERHRDEEALGFFQRSWETSRTPEQRGKSAAGIGRTYRRTGRTNETRQWLERATDAFRKDPQSGFWLAATASELADLYRNTGEYGAAERLLREALGSPCDAESRAILRNNLADLLREEGRNSEAQPLFKESIELSSAPWQQRVGALIGLADIDADHGDWDTSINRWNEALEICRHEGDERSEAIALRGLGMTWLKSGTAARAEPLLRRSLRIMENHADMPVEEVAGAHASLAELYRSENKLALAEGEWSRALQIDRAALGEAHPQVALLMQSLAEVYSAKGEFGIARDYSLRASETMSVSFGENSMPVATVLTNRATIEERAGNLDAAAKDYERALDITRTHPEHRSLQAAMIQRYAELLKVMHRSREAKALLTQVHVEARSFQPK